MSCSWGLEESTERGADERVECKSASAGSQSLCHHVGQPAQGGASTEACRARWTDHVLVTLCEPLDPAVPEAADAPGLLTLLSPSIPLLPNPA